MMNRILLRYGWLWALVVLAVGLTPPGVTAAPVTPGRRELPANLPPEIELIWTHAVAQPQDIAIDCMPLNHPGRTVTYNGDTFPLASIAKILILIEYASRVDTGLIPLDERVNVATLEQYNLPRTDRGAHDRFMATYPVGTTTLPLWDVATEGMIQYSSNAASDYLLDRLAPIDWQPLFNQLALFDTRPPHRLTMIPLLMNNHETGLALPDALPDLSLTLGEAYLDRYLQDQAWREAEISYRSRRFAANGSGNGGNGNGGRGSSRDWPAWTVQQAILQQYSATGSVIDFRNVMTAIYGNFSPLSDNVRYMVRTALRWTGSTYIDNHYVEYGSKLGFYSGGTLTLIAYGEPYGGEPVVSVTFLRNVAQSTYYAMLREDSIGNFAHWLNFNACAGLQELINTSLITE